MCLARGSGIPFRGGASAFRRGARLKKPSSWLLLNGVRPEGFRTPGFAAVWIQSGVQERNLLKLPMAISRGFK